jgi:hypothetical protein
MFDVDYILSLAMMYVLGLVSAPTFQRPARKRGARYVMTHYTIDVDDYRAVVLRWRETGLLAMLLARTRGLGGSLLATPDAITVERRALYAAESPVIPMSEVVLTKSGWGRPSWHVSVFGLAGIFVGIYALAGRWNAQGAAAGLVIAGVSGLLTLRELSYDLTIQLRSGAPIVLSFSPWGFRFPLALRHLDDVADRMNALVDQRRPEAAAVAHGTPAFESPATV